jgi:hypothetical protein
LNVQETTLDQLSILLGIKDTYEYTAVSSTYYLAGADSSEKGSEFRKIEVRVVEV